MRKQDQAAKEKQDELQRVKDARRHYQLQIMRKYILVPLRNQVSSSISKLIKSD